MRTFLFLATLLFSLLPAAALYMQPELKDLPLERLLTNLGERVEAEPKNAGLHHHLARTHAMAYARKLGNADKVKSWGGWRGKEPQHPWFGYEPPHVPYNKLTKAKDDTAKTAARKHLEAAIAAYKKALELESGNTIMTLGLAWCRDQAGDKEAAMTGYRAVLEEAWKKESKSGGGLGNFVYVETAGYLTPHLDPEKDARELAEIDKRKKHLLSLPRAVTPIVVPLNKGRTTLDDLVDRTARVPFDLDATGRQLEWPWITTDAAWLVHDPRQTGRITSAIQMFGSHSFLLFCENGYEALSLLDDDHDGSLEGSELDGLALWRDANSNGISEPGEVKPLGAFRITALSTRGLSHGTGIPYAPAGVRFKDGSTRPTYDLILEAW